jgi:hypothetical protein
MSVNMAAAEAKPLSDIQKSIGDAIQDADKDLRDINEKVWYVIFHAR